MRRHWGRLGLLVAGVVVLVAVGVYAFQRVRGQTPLTLTGPNILQNNDFSLNADGDDMPDGWARGSTGVSLSDFGYAPGGRSVSLVGINNFLKSPLLAARPGAEYRVAFRALADKHATEARIMFHWRDAEGIDFKVTKGAFQPVPVQSWSIIEAADTAPEGATQLAISIHTASDDAIYIADLHLGQVGVRIEPWPAGKPAALAFSFDYETAMGGLIHSRSAGDPNADGDYLVRARRMREGAEQALALFAPDQIRASWYTNGYNFLGGNVEQRQFMGNPVYEWANTEPGHGWDSDRWRTTPWFADDPFSTEQAASEWYFGSQIAELQAARQDIQSHTFAHFAGTYVGPDDWRADFKAWRDVAGERGVVPATSIAFPWSSSGGMRWANWRVLADEGVRSVTRTTVSEGQRRSWIADREQYALRQLPGHAEITAIADVYLTPGSRDRVLDAVRQAWLNQGAIDVWAHTEEVTSADQIAAWQAAIDAARNRFWVAPVPEIVQWSQDIQDVTIEVHDEQPSYIFSVRNASGRALNGVTLTLPFAPPQVEVDGAVVPVDGTRLVLDLAPGARHRVELEAGITDAGEERTSSISRERVWHS